MPKHLSVSRSSSIIHLKHTFPSLHNPISSPGNSLRTTLVVLNQAGTPKNSATAQKLRMTHIRVRIACGVSAGGSFLASTTAIGPFEVEGEEDCGVEWAGVDVGSGFEGDTVSAIFGFVYVWECVAEGIVS